MPLSLARSGCLLFSLIILSSYAAPVSAAEAPIVSDNPYREKIEKETAALSGSMTVAEKKAMSIFMESFGTVRAVRLTRNQVAVAVDKCAAKNPDLSKKINGRFDGWKKIIDPLLKSNERALNYSAGSGVFKEPERVKAYLDLFDKSADYADKKLKKEVLTTPEACGDLLASLDRTEATLADFLKNVEWPVPEEKAVEPKKDPASPAAKKAK